MAQYYLKVPSPNGGWDFVPVDAERLHLGILTEIYERHHSRSKAGGWQFMRSQGVEALARKGVDVSAAVRSLAEWLEDMKTQLNMAGDPQTAELIWKSLFKQFPLGEVLESLAAGREAEASEHLLTFLHAQMSGTFEIAAEIQRMRKELSALENHSTQMIDIVSRSHETLRSSGDRELKLFFEWAESLNALVAAAERLRSQEAQARELLADIRRGIPGIAELMNESDPDVQAAWEVLDSPETGFWPAAKKYLHRPASVPDIADRLGVAKRMLESLRARLDLACETWWQKTEPWQKKLAALKSESDGLLAKLEKAARDSAEFESRYGEDSLLPYQYDNGALITKERYDAAQEILRSSDWSVFAAQNRIQGILFAAQRLPARPAYSEKLVRLLEQAESLVSQVEEKLGIPRAPAVREDRVLPSAPPARPAAPVRTAEPDAIDPARLQALYEQVLCAGYVLTCKPAFYAGSTVKAMLDLLCHLGKVEEAELPVYRPALAELSRRENEREVVRQTKQVTKRWRNSQAVWIQFQPVAKKSMLQYLKLTQSAARNIGALMERHGLTEAAIAEAHAKAREAARERALNRRAKRDPEPEPLEA